MIEVFNYNGSLNFCTNILICYKISKKQVGNNFIKTLMNNIPIAFYKQTVKA